MCERQFTVLMFTVIFFAHIVLPLKSLVPSRGGVGGEKDILLTFHHIEVLFKAYLPPVIPVCTFTYVKMAYPNICVLY